MASVPCEVPGPDDGTMRVRVTELAQLFNSIDPSPFSERDLDAEAERFVVAWARDLPAAGPLRLEVHVDRAPADGEAALAAGVRSFFGRRAQTARRELRTLLRRGRTSLVIGVTFLTACVLAGELAVRQFGPTGTGSVLQQGLTVAGWV